MNQHLRPVALRGLVAASAIVTCAAAQRFSDLPMQHVPMEDVLGNTVTAGDIDGDGDVDIVFPREGSTPLVYRNQGEARFLSDSAGMPAAPLGEIRAALLVDVDADSDLDLVVLRWLARPLLWLNNAGTFTDVSAVNMPNITTQSDPTGVLAGDVDGDNDVDLFLTGNGQVLLLNNGSGVFAHAPAQLPAGIVPGGEGALVDIDTDGDLDFVGARRYWQGTGRHLLYVNNGSGVFTDQSLARLPAATHNYGGGGTVAVGDVDGDHDLDLVAPQHADNISVFRNDGTAVFSALESIPIAGVMHVPYEIFPLLLRLADFDGDGDLDLLVANGGGYGHNLFLNDGTGSFTAARASALPQCRQVLRAQIVADVDGDGDPDIVQATPRQTFQAWPVRAHPVLLNDAHGRFRDPGREAIDQSVDALQCIAGIDFDRDGLLDVIRSTGSPPNSGMLWMHRNDGDNAFVEAGRIWYDHTLGTPRTLAVGDVDGDGWQDFYASSHTGQN
ncbi:MAG TPA: VCBS repeat-containing protein, partial [Planctomycetota bacterium]|nr:VCBS repeat-containing protein [Planctomycetota bacterium]